jgi:hypothetical protein
VREGKPIVAAKAAMDIFGNGETATISAISNPRLYAEDWFAAN